MSLLRWNEADPLPPLPAPTRMLISSTKPEDMA
jgi:hypothetical protein